MSYIYDPTGNLETNLIVQESHTTTVVNNPNEYLIIPDFAPFHLENFVVHKISLNEQQEVITEELLPEINFQFVIQYSAATLSLEKPIYAAISLNAPIDNAAITISYQTLGGDYVSDKTNVLRKLASYIYNPRIILWDMLMDKPVIWPPNPHQLDLVDTTGYSDLLTKFDQLIATIAAGHSQLPPYIQHVAELGNAHHMSKDDIDLGLVENLPIMDNVDARNLFAVRKYVTADGLLFMLSELRRRGFFSDQMAISSVLAVDMVEVGAGYTNIPDVIVQSLDGNGSGAILEAQLGLPISDNDGNISYSVVSIKVLNGGAGYTAVPNIIIQGNGSGATALASM